MREDKKASLRRLFVDAMKYGAVSVIALAVDFGSLLILHSVFNIHYLLAATISFLFGLVVNYTLSHERVFTDPVIKNRPVNFLVFAVIGVIGLIGNDFIMWFGHECMGLTVFWSKCIAVGIVFFWNFLARRQLLYSGHRSKNNE